MYLFILGKFTYIDGNYGIMYGQVNVNCTLERNI